jgi:putative transposase
MVDEHQLSERRACRLVGLSRDSYRHPPKMTEATQQLSDRIVQIAHERRRFGYRRIHDMLKPDFPGINHKRVYRLYSAANLAVRKRRKAKRPTNERVPLQLARTVNEVWSMDFVSNSLSRGRRLKCLTVADDFSHECVDIAVDFGMSGEYVARVLDAAARFRGYPRAVRTDNGGVRQPGIHGLGAAPRHPAHPDPAGQADAERLHRELQQQVSR